MTFNEVRGEDICFSKEKRTPQRGGHLLFLRKKDICYSIEEWHLFSTEEKPICCSTEEKPICFSTEKRTSVVPQSRGHLWFHRGEDICFPQRRNPSVVPQRRNSSVVPQRRNPSVFPQRRGHFLFHRVEDSVIP
jgi:hypothetical protein